MRKEQDKDVDLGTDSGTYVAKAESEGAGAEAGLQEDDIITNLNGKEISRMTELQEIIYSKWPGEKITITCLHSKKKDTKTVTLRNTQGNTNIVKMADLGVLGGNFRKITSAQEWQIRTSYGLEVIKISKGALKETGISKGFIILEVNDIPTKVLKDLQAAVKRASINRDPVLYIKGIWPSGKRNYFAVTVNRQAFKQS